MRKIKVLHIIEDLGMGGAEKVVYNLCGGLDGARFDVRVWCLTRGGIMAERLAQFGLAPEILAMGPRPTLGFLRALAARLRAQSFDIVHAHGYTAGAVARTAAVAARVPRIIAHAHTTCRHLGLKQRWTDRFLSFFTDRIICCSDEVARSLAEREGIARRKLCVVHNGTPPMPRKAPTGLRERLSIAPDDAVILCAAAMVPHKGHRFLIEAFAVVHGRFPRTTLVLAGDGPLRPEMENLAQRLGVAGQVVFTGIYSQIGELIGLCDIAVLASSQREGMSLWLAEAMSAGRPLVATAVGGTSEVLSHEVNGLLVEPASSSALAAAIGRLLGNSTLAKSLGEAGSHIYQEEFTLEQMISRISAIYEDLVHG